MTERKKRIDIVTSCYNEALNLREFHRRLRTVAASLPQYDFRITAADNGSDDDSRAILRQLAAQDPDFRVILNSANFGPVRSGYNVFRQADGDAVVMMCSDLQDPPELIPELVEAWEKGNKIVCAIKASSRESGLMFAIRKLYYFLLSKVSDVDMIRNFTGFGLYDKQAVDALKQFQEPYPYFRGLVGEIGFRRTEIPYEQPRRIAGRSSYNFARYFDYAMTGFVNHSKLPLRLATFAGFALAALSLLTALGYLVYKLLYWDTFQLGLAPLVIGLFFFSAVQLIFIGILGEYLGAVWTQVKNKPLVIEEERINFDE